MVSLIANVLAIIAAPLITLWVGFQIQNRKLTYERKYRVFGILMAERASPTSPAAVGALNTIDVEFKSHPAVLQSWHAYYDLLNSTEFREWNLDRQAQESKRRRAQLLLDMVGALKFKERFTIEDFERGYLPEALSGPQVLSRAMFQTMANGMEKLGGVPIALVNVSGHAIFDGGTSESQTAST